MRLNLRNRILFNFVLVIAAFGLLGGLAGVYFINHTTIKEEQRRVSVDLRSAWSVIHGKFQELSMLVSVLSTGKRVAGAYEAADSKSPRVLLEAVRRQFGLDFLTLTDDQGRVILRTSAPYASGDDLANDPFVSSALKGQIKSGFKVLAPERLQLEGGDLQERAFIVFKSTPKAKPRLKTSEASGLAMIAAAPVRDLKGNVFGTVYAGFLLNRNHALVDHIRSIAFEKELLDGRPIGTVTIFQWDVRVATNVILPNGNRALGTRVSAEVYDKVLENNRSWYDRAFVVNDWYISAYDPIHDVEDKVIGILYVGVLAKKYDEIRKNLWKIYGGLSVVTAFLVGLVGLVFSRRLTRSVSRLGEASRRIAGGELNLRVREPKADDELRDLTRAFNSMAGSLHDREERLKAAQVKLEQTNAALQQLNQNYLDMLGFVSHELKNTLGVIYTSARALDAGLTGTLTPDQASLVHGIASNIETAVTMTRQYLDLTRIEKGELRVQVQDIDLVTGVVNPVLDELKPVVAQRGVKVLNTLPQALPLSGDPTLLRVVYKNLLDNALKYGRPGGQIRLGFEQEADRYRLDVFNEGQGLAPDKLARLFGKFVRFKTDPETDRKGTGLGLFITKEIIGKHGGAIWAESEEGQWMSFIFTLPAAGSKPAS
ncbi:MAG: cache domain-containing protein [Deltaproteobacteria bacterium]|nr:cache domain-containing protein [Deltaproteobacteria bacterium]